MSSKDRQEFKDYLRACTANQVCGVYLKETEAGRSDYAELAKDEAERRQIDIE